MPSVVAGLLAQPIIAVPTSTGYGAGAGGETALRAMLSSCANGVSVVNIDSGHGAAMKKGRPGFRLSVLVDEARRDALADYILEETTTISRPLLSG